MIFKTYYRITIPNSKFFFDEYETQEEAEAVAITNGIDIKCVDKIEMDKTDKAIAYMENHGIIEAHQTDENTLVYYSSFPLSRSTIKAVVSLDTGKEVREYMKHYYTAYKGKIGGKYTANYMA